MLPPPPFLTWFPLMWSLECLICFDLMEKLYLPPPLSFFTWGKHCHQRTQASVLCIQFVDNAIPSGLGHITNQEQIALDYLQSGSCASSLCCCCFHSKRASNACVPSWLEGMALSTSWMQRAEACVLSRKTRGLLSGGIAIRIVQARKAQVFLK